MPAVLVLPIPPPARRTGSDDLETLADGRVAEIALRVRPRATSCPRYARPSPATASSAPGRVITETRATSRPFIERRRAGSACRGRCRSDRHPLVAANPASITVRFVTLDARRARCSDLCTRAMRFVTRTRRGRRCADFCTPEAATTPVQADGPSGGRSSAGGSRMRSGRSRSPRGSSAMESCAAGPRRRPEQRNGPGAKPPRPFVGRMFYYVLRLPALICVPSRKRILRKRWQPQSGGKAGIMGWRS